MDIVLGIFSKLGVDSSFIYQCIIVVVMVFACKFLIFGHMQKIIEGREEKTVGLSGSTDEKLIQVSEIQAQYQQKIQTANKNAKVKIDELKVKIAKKEEAKYREHENEINVFIEQAKNGIQAEIRVKKEAILSEAGKLSNSLVEKITKG